MFTPRDEVLLTSGQAAAFLGLSQATVLRWSRAGRIPCVRSAAGHRRFRLGDLETILNAGSPSVTDESVPREPGQAAATGG